MDIIYLRCPILCSIPIVFRPISLALGPFLLCRRWDRPPTPPPLVPFRLFGRRKLDLKMWISLLLFSSISREITIIITHYKQKEGFDYSPSFFWIWYVQSRDFLGGVFAPFRMKTWTSASRPGAPSVPDSTWDNRIFTDESWKVRRTRAGEEIKLTFWLTNSAANKVWTLYLFA